MPDSIDQPAKTPLQIEIARLIERSGRTRDSLDRHLGEVLNTKGKPLYDIERGKSRKPSYATLEAIAELCGVSVERLTRASSGHAPKVEPDQPPIKSAHAGDGPILLRRINLSYALGPGTNIDDYVDEDTVEFDANELRKISASAPELLYVGGGAGDSMFPTLLDSDAFIIDTGQRYLNLQDRIWAMSLFGAGAVKRLRAIGKGRILVISDNPSVDNQEVDGEDIIILGRIVHLSRRM